MVAIETTRAPVLPRLLSGRSSYLIVLGFAFAVFLINTPPSLFLHDEGLILTGALRILHGEMPSVDFYVSYGPAQYAIVAALFEIFGQTVTTARIYDAVSAATIPVLVLWIMNGMAAPPAGAGIKVTILLTVLLLIVAVKFPLYPVMQITALILLGCGILSARLQQDSPLRAYRPLAMLLVIIAAFRYDTAFLAAGLFGLPVVLMSAWKLWGGHTMLRREVVKLFGLGAMFCAGIGATLLLLSLFGIVPAAFIDIVTYNTGTYAETRWLPFPRVADALRSPLAAAVIYGPLLVMGAAVIVLVIRLRRGALFSTGLQVPLLVYMVATLVLYSHALVRTDAVHALPAAIAAAPLFFAICWSFQRPRTLPAWVGAGAVSALALVLTLSLASRSVASVQSFHERWTHRAESPLPALGPFYALSEERRQAIDFIRDNTREDERILVASGRHDKVFVSDAAFYFLAERLPATRWHQYDPGVQTTETVQTEIISDLEENRVRFLVQDASWDDVREPNQSALSSGVRRLDSYIAQNYTPVWREGAITILERME